MEKRTVQDLVKSAQDLVDFVREKIEAGQIVWDNDAPILEGLLEECEGDITDLKS